MHRRYNGIEKNKREYANELGIFLPHYELGEHRIRCPQCSIQEEKNMMNAYL
jgi:hypothetical protein